MRRVVRQPLAPSDAVALAKRQRAVDAELANGEIDIQQWWKNARRTRLLRRVAEALARMAGPAERCMYCLDSHGTDIEHWRPKARFPGRMFVWENLLLCCAECGRWKGDEFPTTMDGHALLLDPTADDPWAHLDFDPLTGMLAPRFDPVAERFDARGEATIALLRFAERDAMHEQYRRTWRRLCRVVRAAVARPAAEGSTLLRELAEEDDHGLLAWCFSTRGAAESPFRELQQRHPKAFAECAAAVSSS